jgi:hypothetical protein
MKTIHGIKATIPRWAPVHQPAPSSATGTAEAHLLLTLGRERAVCKGERNLNEVGVIYPMIATRLHGTR